MVENVFQWMSLAFTLCPFIFDTICIIMVPQVINFRNQIMFQFAVWVNKMKPHSVCHLKFAMYRCRWVQHGEWHDERFVFHIPIHVLCEHYHREIQWNIIIIKIVCHANRTNGPFQTESPKFHYPGQVYMCPFGCDWSLNGSKAKPQTFRAYFINFVSLLSY